MHCVFALFCSALALVSVRLPSLNLRWAVFVFFPVHRHCFTLSTCCVLVWQFWLGKHLYRIKESKTFRARSLKPNALEAPKSSDAAPYKRPRFTAHTLTPKASHESRMLNDDTEY
uniref:Putative secreted protein n=1 Tax=Anopheles marajoara TaxID=58244 RepID=A0A2M4C7V3_9DIPT